MKNQLADYLHFLRVERGLSENTIKSYRQDLTEAIQFFQKTTQSFSQVDQFLILNYLEQMQREKKSRRTVIRTVSSLRNFFRYLAQFNVITSDPMLKVDSPKQAKTLPDVLTVPEVTKLLAMPNVSKALGVRDRAILETFMLRD